MNSAILNLPYHCRPIAYSSSSSTELALAVVMVQAKDVVRLFVEVFEQADGCLEVMGCTPVCIMGLFQSVKGNHYIEGNTVRSANIMTPMYLHPNLLVIYPVRDDTKTFQKRSFATQGANNIRQVVSEGRFTTTDTDIFQTLKEWV